MADKSESPASQPEAKPESKSEDKPEGKPEAKPESKPEGKPINTEASSTAAKPDAKPEANKSGKPAETSAAGNSAEQPVEKKDASAKPEDREQKPEQPKSETDPNKAEREAYAKLRKSLKELVAKKLSIDRELESIEERIYVEEGTYLQEASAGNVVKGFEQYTKSNQNRRKSVLVEQDRVFSQSSTSFDAEM